MLSLDFPDAGFGTIEVSFAYADRQALREVDFHVMPGEIHALVGKQNEGKSTLCGVLTGTVRPSGGWILAGGKPYRFLTPQLARGLGVEYVGKEAKVFPDLSVAENIFTGDDGPWWKRFTLWNREFRRTRDWLAGFGVDLPYSEPIRRIHREDWLFVELLSRLRRRPRLLILDETLEQLSDRRAREFERMAGRLGRDGMAVLWVTHKIEEALEKTERITVLRRGRVLFASPAASIDKVSLVRVCFSELGRDDGENVTMEQFYELIRFIEAMLRDMPAMVLIADLDRRIRLVNRSLERTFPSRREWIGEDLGAFLGGLNARLADEADACMADGQDRDWHSLQVDRESDGMLVDVRLRGIQEREVRVGHMVVIEDVSVRENMRRSLALSDNLASIGLLAAGVAHEVNDPLAIISNYLGFIRHEARDAEIARAVRLAQDEIGRIQQIVDNLVAFSAKDPAGAEAVDVMSLARELCNLLRFHSGARRVTFACNGPERPLLARIDANEMRQVLLNLLRNALDAIEGDGRVSLDGDVAHDADGRRVVRLTVSDDGAGIMLDNPEDMFRPFVSTKRGRDAHQGLGLSIVYGIVEKYGGRIQGRNRARGGCQMILTLPLAEAE